MDCGNVLIQEFDDLNQEYIVCRRCNYRIKINAYEPWYSPGKIKYNWDDNIWLITFVYGLPVGEWPPEIAECEGRSGFHSAPFEAACCALSELEVRLIKTMDDGEALVSQCKSYYAHYHRTIEINLLDYNAGCALKYISGDRKKMSYRKWKNQKNRRASKDLTKTNKCANVRGTI
jgi:hypothetical protein